MHVDYGINDAPNWNSAAYIDTNYDPTMSTNNVTIPSSQCIAADIFPGLELAQSVALRLFGTFYNLFYVILVNLVLQAIISGLFIDTFSSMRAESEAKEADMKNSCYICFFSRDDFETAGLSFDAHIRGEHNVWKYVWLKLHLELSDLSNFSGPNCLRPHSVVINRPSQVSCLSRRVGCFSR